MLGIVYKNGVEIDRGIYTGGKHKTAACPDQSISICDSCDAYRIENERSYRHGDGISFQVYQERDYLAYDSNEGVDHSINYPMPSWLKGVGVALNYKHSLDENGQEQTEYKGVIK